MEHTSSVASPMSSPMSSALPPAPPQKFFAATRLHRPDASVDAGQLLNKLRRVIECVGGAKCDGFLVAYPLWDGFLRRSIDRILKSKQRRFPQLKVLEPVPVPYWGSFTPALSCIVSAALAKKADLLMVLSLEMIVNGVAVDILRSYLTPGKTLVVGPALANSHLFGNERNAVFAMDEDEDEKYCQNSCERTAEAALCRREGRNEPKALEREEVGNGSSAGSSGGGAVIASKEKSIHFVVSGANIPWNTCAIWDLKKLSLFGFPSIADGHLPNVEKGIEEVVAINVAQASLGVDNAEVKLVRIAKPAQAAGVGTAGANAKSPATRPSGAVAVRVGGQAAAPGDEVEGAAPSDEKPFSFLPDHRRKGSLGDAEAPPPGKSSGASASTSAGSAVSSASGLKTSSLTSHSTVTSAGPPVVLGARNSGSTPPPLPQSMAARGVSGPQGLVSLNPASANASSKVVSIAEEGAVSGSATTSGNKDGRGFSEGRGRGFSEEQEVDPGDGADCVPICIWDTFGDEWINLMQTGASRTLAREVSHMIDEDHSPLAAPGEHLQLLLPPNLPGVAPTLGVALQNPSFDKMSIHSILESSGGAGSFKDVAGAAGSSASPLDDTGGAVVGSSLGALPALANRPLSNSNLVMSMSGLRSGASDEVEGGQSGARNANVTTTGAPASASAASASASAALLRDHETENYRDGDVESQTVNSATDSVDVEGAAPVGAEDGYAPGSSGTRGPSGQLLPAAPSLLANHGNNSSAGSLVNGASQHQLHHLQGGDGSGPASPQQPASLPLHRVDSATSVASSAGSELSRIIFGPSTRVSGTGSATKELLRRTSPKGVVQPLPRASDDGAEVIANPGTGASASTSFVQGSMFTKEQEKTLTREEKHARKCATKITRAESQMRVLQHLSPGVVEHIVHECL
eukprot:CAMPEP_0179002948 /NCGR_PEP_ID=MMETSP0795-20121207/12365_1 /TAXON_ID=88552 /ORGANISM="Amoebophrya sp., Strain Ameob2" /LENGTH=916 /DNA_ID=CAMNT_0020696821 /DNA_START=524 /DNA_END=3274 /DNA_ORIENTATION=+